MDPFRRITLLERHVPINPSADQHLTLPFQVADGYALVSGDSDKKRCLLERDWEMDKIEVEVIDPKILQGTLEGRPDMFLSRTRVKMVAAQG